MYGKFHKKEHRTECHMRRNAPVRKVGKEKNPGKVDFFFTEQNGGEGTRRTDGHLPGTYSRQGLSPEIRVINSGSQCLFFSNID